jgi:hypothetical protein
MFPQCFTVYNMALLQTKSNPDTAHPFPYRQAKTAHPYVPKPLKGSFELICEYISPTKGSNEALTTQERTNRGTLCYVPEQFINVAIPARLEDETEHFGSVQTGLKTYSEVDDIS